jgi:acyl carrier protein
MSITTTQNRLDEEVITKGLIARIVEMTRDWYDEPPGEIRADTLLVETLGFTSMDFVMLIVDIQQHYNRYDLPFDDLFAPSGCYVSDLEVREIVHFLCRHLNA